MSYIIGSKCISEKDGACILACPVDCIHEGEESMYINPEECIDCGACVPECPVEAIFDTEEDAIEAGELEAVKNNYKFFNLSYGE
ncbi:ferredoxin family protein [bacterium]|nr:ferredoxin family protein [bacterium]